MQRATVTVYRSADSTMIKVTSLKPRRRETRELRGKADAVRAWTFHNFMMIQPEIMMHMSIISENPVRYTEIEQLTSSEEIEYNSYDVERVQEWLQLGYLWYRRVYMQSG